MPKPRALKVIVADDEPDAVLTLSALLEDEGHKVRGVHDGEAVIKAVVMDDPDAVVIDINMPGMSGFAIAQQIRQVFGAEAPLLIAITGQRKGQTDKMLGRLVGFDYYLLKPVEPRELLKLLARVGAPSQITVM